MMDLRLEPGWFGAFTREEAPGALKNGTRIVKVWCEAGDATRLGIQGTVLGSIIHPSIDSGNPMYFIEWDNRLRCAVGTITKKIAAVE